MLRVLRVMVLIGGLSLIAIGLAAGLFAAGTAWLTPADLAAVPVTLSLSLSAFCLALGSATAWQAWQSIHERPSGLFAPRRIWPLFGLLVGAVLLGQWVLSLGSLGPPLFALLNLAATALPALIVLALVGRWLAGVTRRREIVLQLGCGAVVSTTLAMMLELTLLLVLAVAAVAVVAALPGGPEQLQSLASRLQDPASLSDPALLGRLAGSPIAWIAALLVVAGAVPIVEETVKTAGVGLMSYRRPSLAQAYVWGLTCGVGFAIMESLLNSVMDLSSWVPTILGRIGASLMHCVTGGLMGIAWSSLMSRRWRNAIGLYFASLFVHGSWNALTVSLSLLALGRSPGGPLGLGPGSASPAITGIVAALVLMALAACVGLAALTRFVRSRAGATVAPSQGGDESRRGSVGDSAARLPPSEEPP